MRPSTAVRCSKWRCPIVTTVNLDNGLIKEAIKLGKFKSREQALNAALAEYVQLQKRRSLVALAGTIHYREDYDHKKLRARKGK